MKLTVDSDVSFQANWVSFQGNCGKLRGLEIVTQLGKTCSMYANVGHNGTCSRYAS